jgi:hypothetical protein
MDTIEPTTDGLLLQDHNMIYEESDKAKLYGQCEIGDDLWPIDGLLNFI